MVTCDVWAGVSPFLIIGTHLAKTFDIPKMSVRINCTAPKLMPTLLSMLHSSRLLSHITRVCTYDLYIFISGGIFGAARPSIILNALSPPLKLCCPFFHCANKDTPSQGFPWNLHKFPWEAFLSYRSTWWLLWFQVSPFCKCVAPSSLKSAYISNQAWPHAFHTPNVLQLNQMTDWQRF